MNLLTELFFAFAKIGAFTFGGGYAMLSLIENTCVSEKKWITHEEMMDITVIAESTPGPIAINCATYVGYKQKGVAGAVAATLGMVMPSFLVIYMISVFFDNFLEFTLFAKAFRGIKAAVGILILNAGINMAKKMKKKKIPVVIMTVSGISMLLIQWQQWKVSSITLMIIAGICSLLLFLREDRTKGAKGK